MIFPLDPVKVPDVITHLCHTLNGGLTKVPLESGYWWKFINVPQKIGIVYYSYPNISRVY